MTDQTKPALSLYALTPEQHATVLAALGQFQGLCASLEQRGTPDRRSLTTAHGTVIPLGYDGTGKLIASLENTGLNFSQAAAMFAESAKESPYVRAARENQSEGAFEVDDPAVVSKGDDDGAYVMGWKWVSNEQAGVKTYWTVQLVADPDKKVWYFEDPERCEQAAFAIGLQGQDMIEGSADELPEGESVADPAEFAAWVVTFAHMKKPE